MKKGTAQYEVAKIIAESYPGQRVLISEFLVDPPFSREAIQSAVRRCCGHKPSWKSEWNGMLYWSGEKKQRALVFTITSQARKIFERLTGESLKPAKKPKKKTFKTITERLTSCESQIRMLFARVGGLETVLSKVLWAIGEEANIRHNNMRRLWKEIQETINKK